MRRSQAVARRTRPSPPTCPVVVDLSVAADGTPLFILAGRPADLWTAEQVDGVTVWRADTVHDGAPIALVASPSPDGRWLARCGRGSTRDLAERGDLLTVEATAEKAKVCAASWAEGV